MPNNFLESIIQGYNMRQQALARQDELARIAQARTDNLDQQSWARTQANKQFTAQQEAQEWAKKLGLFNAQTQGLGKQVAAGTPGALDFGGVALAPNFEERTEFLNKTELDKLKSTQSINFDFAKKTAETEIDLKEQERDNYANDFMEFVATNPTAFDPDEVNRMFVQIKFPGLGGSDAKPDYESTGAKALIAMNRAKPGTPEFISAEKLFKSALNAQSELYSQRATTRSPIPQLNYNNQQEALLLGGEASAVADKALQHLPILNIIPNSRDYAKYRVQLRYLHKLRAQDPTNPRIGQAIKEAEAFGSSNKPPAVDNISDAELDAAILKALQPK